MKREKNMPRISALRIVSLTTFIFLAFFGVSQFGSKVSAQETMERSGFWGGINIGIGSVQQSFEGTEENQERFFLGFEGGYTLSPNFLVGVELSGWLIESSNLEDPSEGEGIMQAFLTTRCYPSSTMGLFAKIGGGYVSHWNNQPGEPRRESGYGVTFGGGYDFPINKNFAITPFINYSYWETDDRNHDAWTFGIGLTMQ